MAKYKATCSVWFTQDAERITKMETFEADRLESYDGIERLISKYIRANFDGVWRCPVIKVEKDGKHHGYYSWVNSCFRRLSFDRQGESLSARKRRMKDLQNRGYSQLFAVFSDFHGKNKEKYKERTGVCLDALSDKLNERVRVITQQN